MNSLSLESVLARHRELIDAALRTAVPRSEALPERLHGAMNYSLLAGGKRIRPALCLLACEAVGGDVAKAVPAATALELVHTYSLIHDDLPAMDDDDLRRGRPTCHKQFDEATAILAGDALLTRAFELIAEDGRTAGLDDRTIVRSVITLSNAAGMQGMVGGQMADLEGETSACLSVEQLVAVHERKTGRLMSAAVALGALAGGADEKQLTQSATFGDNIGLAFQIADDVLDETGDAETIGKEVRKDAGRGKATYPTLLGLDESRRRAEALIAEAIAAIEPLGERAGPLVVIARYIIDRDR